MRAKTLQIMGFYNVLYNISNFGSGVNFPFKGSKVYTFYPRSIFSCLLMNPNKPQVWSLAKTIPVACLDSLKGNKV